jgi:prepilin-type N-terminal cleavage/methylation domain-containing protein
MRKDRRESGFTLIELLVVVGLIVVVLATIGTFFLGGPSPAVASAARDIGAVFDEARETATAFDAATVVFSPTVNGYSARVYRAMPGTPTFAAVNGPTYDSTVTIAETAAPLGAPAFAFRVDSRGTVTGYQNFDPSSATFTERACPAAGNFILALAYARQRRTIDIPCVISLAMNAPALTVTPAPATSAPPDVPGTCAPSQACTASLPPFTATCPPGDTPDATQPNVCDMPTPAPSMTPTDVPASPTPPPAITPSPNQSPSPGSHVAIENYCIAASGTNNDSFGNSTQVSAESCLTMFGDETWEISNGFTPLVCGTAQETYLDSTSWANPQYETTISNEISNSQETGPWYSSRFFLINGLETVQGADNIQDSSDDWWCPGYSDP